MKVDDTVRVYDGHSYEWGSSTWDDNERSIRNRFDTADGKFNKAGSGEIPWEDFNQMIITSIQQNHFTTIEIANITRSVADFIGRDE